MKRTAMVWTVAVLLAVAVRPAAAEPVLKLGAVNALRGMPLCMDLSLAGGTQSYAGVNARILLPAGMSVSGVAKGVLLPVDFKTDWHGFSDAGGTGANVIAYSGTSIFSGPSGVLLNLTVQVPAAAPLGKQIVSLTDSGLSDRNGTVSVPHSRVNGTILCFAGSHDSDGDGLSNAVEIGMHSDPLRWDSDGDGYSDSQELKAGTDPLDKNSMPVVHVDIKNVSGVEDGTREHPYNTIGEGIIAASPAYTVLVAPGRYREAVSIDKDVRLTGKNSRSTIIDGQDAANAVSFGPNSGDLCSIEGFTVKNAAAGIRAAKGASPLIRNNVVTGVRTVGIVCGALSTARVINNTVSGNSGATAVRIYSSKVRLINNILSENLVGIRCDNAAPLMDYNDLWSHPGGHYVGCGAGKHDISRNPRFVDPSAGDFRLNSGSPCIDTGDPMERLTLDYTAGNRLTVDQVTWLAVGDRVWITDGTNTESVMVGAVTASTIRMKNALMSSYLVADNTRVYTETSDARKEPAPGNVRIDRGAYGNTPRAGGVTAAGATAEPD